MADIVASIILVARHLKTIEEFRDSKYDTLTEFARDPCRVGEEERVVGGQCRARTCDLLLVRQAL